MVQSLTLLTERKRLLSEGGPAESAGLWGSLLVVIRREELVSASSLQCSDRLCSLYLDYVFAAN